MYRLILQFLKDSKKNHVPKDDLEKHLYKKYMNNTRSRKMGTNKKGYIKDIDDFLKELALLGLVNVDKDNIMIKKPFLIEVTISVTKSGHAFGIPTDATHKNKDVFIHFLNRKAANHLDIATVSIMDKYQNRLEGKVEKINHIHIQNSVAKVIDKHHHGFLAQVIDFVDHPIVILKTHKKIALNCYVQVQRTNEFMSCYIPNINQIKSMNNRRVGKNNLNTSNKILQKVGIYSLSSIYTKKSALLSIDRILNKYNLHKNYPKKLVPHKKEVEITFRAGLKDKHRKNLKHLYTCTIDGEDAKDFDDAISIEEHKDSIILYVHIADVSYFIQKDTPLDEEAFTRGNSVYLNHTVLPMLPNIFSEEYCSLKPKTTRLAFTCQMFFTLEGELLKYNFFKSTIFLDKRFTYNEAETCLDDTSSPLFLFWKFAKILKKNRVSQKGIALDIPQIKFIFNNKDKVKKITVEENLRSHQLIEEFMLAANICAAKITKKNKIPSLYRVHDAIKVDSLNKINLLLKLMGSKSEIKNLEYSSLMKVIKEIKSPVFNFMLLRCFMQALYDNEPQGHWGLGFSDYTHFTSPIRRYCDLIVHRQIDTILKNTSTTSNGILNKKSDYQQDDIKAIGMSISKKERIALDAEKSMIKMLAIAYIKKTKQKKWDATFMGFNQYGLYIALLPYLLDAFIPCSNFNQTGYIHSYNDYQVLVDKYNKSIFVGQKLEVSIQKIDYEKVEIVCSIVKII